MHMLLGLWKKLPKLFFWVFAPTEKLKLAAILNFSKTLKKSPAHFHIVGTLVEKFE